MTNTVTIPSNMLPEDGRFGSGPTKIRPEQIQALDKGARRLRLADHPQGRIRHVRLIQLEVRQVSAIRTVPRGAGDFRRRAGNLPSAGAHGIRGHLLLGP